MVDFPDGITVGWEADGKLEKEVFILVLHYISEVTPNEQAFTECL